MIYLEDVSLMKRLTFQLLFILVLLAVARLHFDGVTHIYPQRNCYLTQSSYCSIIARVSP